VPVGDSGAGDPVVQKVIDVVGVSPKSFADAAANAVEVAGETVRGMRWARVSEFEMALDGEKVETYRATVRIYFDVDRAARAAAPSTASRKESTPRASRRRKAPSKKTKVSRAPPPEPQEDEEAAEDES